MQQTIFNQFRIRQQRIVWVTGALALLATSARAQDTIFDTTGGNTAFTFPAYQVGPDPYYASALEFGVTSAANLSSIGLILYAGDIGIDLPVYTVQLTYPGANQPGAVIDSWTTYGSSALVTLTPNGADSLAVGVYDVVVSSSIVGAWSINYNFYGTTQFYGPSGWINSTQEPLPEMQVQVTPAATPEPTSVAVMGAGVIGLLLRRRTSRSSG